ncbi:hypothetical protein VTL71DRAFT_4633 [Oculimacula yallundae]|uniref:Uncharacterized protein n=1 Tax=Oculimacula yallundae TaxID=86028 RepID=A0ABR4C2L2_9HELO
MSSSSLPPGWGVDFPSLVTSPSPASSSTASSTVQVSIVSTLPTNISTSTSTPPTPTDFTVVLPFPPPNSTTITSLITLQATSITTLITTTISTNIISTVTQTSTTLSISITPFGNPAATSAIAGQTSLLRSNNSLSKTNFTVSLVLGSLAILLLAALLTIFLLYVRKRRKGERLRDDDESPPLTSLAPRPAMGFREGTFGSASAGLGVGVGATSALPDSAQSNRSRDREWERSVGEVYETSLSMGPRGGTRESQARVGAGFSVSTPRRVFFRSSSAPVEAPTPPPRIPPFKGLALPGTSIFGKSPRGTLTPDSKGKDKDVERDSPRFATSSGAGSGVGGGMRSAPLEPRPGMEIMKLVRQSSMPLYHNALRDQAEVEREASGRLEAEGSGLPIIAVQRTTSPSQDWVGRGSEESLVSGLFSSEDTVRKSVERGDLDGEESDSSDERDRERKRKAGLGLRVGMGGNDNGRVGVVHSTRASSGVFPEG